MLLRSVSSPMLNSWLHPSKNPSPDPEIVPQIPRSRSIVLASSSSNSLSHIIDASAQKMTRALSETDLRDPSLHKKKNYSKTLDGFSEVDEEEEVACSKMASLSCGLLSGCENGSGNGGFVSVLVGGGVGVGGCGGKIYGGGGSDGGDDGSSRFGDSNHGNGSIDLYYQKMIEANPGNSMLLSNYARFLKEVREDYVKAEEYCERAILSNPGDGSVLSMYADLIWRTHKDSPRAESYFDQAVKAAPDDCFILASYARFLWDAEEDDEEEVGGERFCETSSPNFFQGALTPPPLAAAS